MPNHDTTLLTVTAKDDTPDAINALIRFSNTCQRFDADPELTLCLTDIFDPMPDKYRDTVSGSNPVYADDGLTWYEWATEHWGTKWGTYEEQIVEITDDRITIEFQSAWNPPMRFLRRLDQPLGDRRR